jgi:hypothetical protein
VERPNPRRSGAIVEAHGEEGMGFYDTHNHLQDGRLYCGGAPDREQVARLRAECGEEQGGMVLNGTSGTEVFASSLYRSIHGACTWCLGV